MMKAFISTFCTWESYGSVIQSLGLKKTLEELGVSSQIILREPKPVFVQKPILSASLGRTIVHAHDRLIQSKRKLAFDRGNAFIQEYLDLVYWPESRDALEGRQIADLYLAGSDQVWNPVLCNPDFFLDFVPKGKKKISYSASMGTTEIPAASRESIRDWLQCFDRISVREDACKEVLSQLVDREISVNIDPSFLRAAEEWRKRERPYGLEKPYILLYAIYWDPALNSQVRRLHQRTGLPVIVLSGHLNKCFATERIYDAGPAEFIWLIDHADYVVTSSFHAVALSILFQKRFSAALNPASPSRIQNLCSRLHIPMLRIEELDSADRETSFAETESRILEERERGIEYLREAIRSL